MFWSNPQSGLFRSHVSFRVACCDLRTYVTRAPVGTPGTLIRHPKNTRAGEYDSTGTRVQPPLLPVTTRSRFSAPRKRVLTRVRCEPARVPGQISLFPSLPLRSLHRHVDYRGTPRYNTKRIHRSAVAARLDAATTSAPLLVALTLVACTPAPRNLASA